MNERMPFQHQAGGYQALPLAACVKALHLALGMFFRAMRTARALGLDKESAAFSTNLFVRVLTTRDLKAELTQAYQEAMRAGARRNTGGNVIHFPKS